MLKPFVFSKVIDLDVRTVIITQSTRSSLCAIAMCQFFAGSGIRVSERFDSGVSEHPGAERGQRADGLSH